MIPVQNSIELVMWIESHLQNLSLAQLDRTRVAAACFAVALEHHHAIVILLREARIASAFALVRSQFEAYVRGVWFVECATDVQLNSFLSDKSRPKIEQLLCAIEEQPAFDSKELSGIKATNWKSMCSYIHTGWHQVSRWITSEAIEPRYSREEIVEVLDFVNGFGLLAAFGVAKLANNELLAAQFFERSGEFLTN